MSTATRERVLRVLIGEGGLNWPASERRSDRYGRVGLQRVGPMPATTEALAAGIEPGTLYPTGDWILLSGMEAALAPGRLVAEVVETRQSGHIGDLFRGIGPSTPAVGERVVLGEGRLFFEEEDEGWLVGLLPADGRADDWLDPRALYRVHAQTVRLYFEPSEGER
jgi:hypothetical protein